MPLLILLLLAAAPEGDTYLKSMAEWRAAREARLESDTGWLTVSGLVWLKDGPNTIGASPSADVVLPAPAPDAVGSITVKDGEAVFAAASGAAPRTEGRTVQRLPLQPDVTTLEIGPVSFLVIERAGRLGVRIRDKNARARREFSGLKWYPIDPRWRVRARLEAPARPRRQPIATILGDRIEMESAGQLVFTLDGRELRLEALFETDERHELFIMFKDRTNGEATYGAGRYMYVDVPGDGYVELDFNKAYNPPCAYTDFATCPLPPGQNWLPVPIAAGEQKYDAAH